MFRYVLILIIAICISCKGEPKIEKGVLYDDALSITSSDEKDTFQNTINHVAPTLVDKKEIQKKKEVEKVEAEKQLAKDREKSKLKDVSCEEIFKIYERLILKAKETKDKADIRKLNEYKGDPNFRECRKNPDYKDIYNKLEKLKHSK